MSTRKAKANGSTTAKDLASPVRRALVVGINDYGDPRNNLNSCVADAQSFARLLREAYGFTDITELHDGEATLSNVRSGLDGLVDGIGPDDRVVYFQSSHGHHLQQGSEWQEVLVVRSDTPDKPYAFLTDDELSGRTQGLPGGVLTVVLDSCYSGGMNKLLFDQQDIGVVRSKVLVPVDPDDLPKAFAPASPSFKPFGRRPIRSSATLAQLWNMPEESRKAFAVQSKVIGDESGDVEINGLLLAACLEDETAAAGTPRTNNLSALTYALLKAVDELGSDASARTLMDEAKRVLANLNMRQTPVLAEPPQPVGMADRSFVLLNEAAKAFAPDDAPDAQLFDHIQELFAKAFAAAS